jgi:hypothetical protein
MMMMYTVVDCKLLRNGIGGMNQGLVGALASQPYSRTYSIIFESFQI